MGLAGRNERGGCGAHVEESYFLPGLTVMMFLRMMMMILIGDDGFDDDAEYMDVRLLNRMPESL